ncbi:MAG: bifunctional riboflavin kinase/FAD synthetase [Bacteroidota bacterium]|nr:bifunctional riboflavin kinase/FAD synthetase [Bacteroidota bacterium]
MKVYDLHHDILPEFKDTVVSIGAYDGLHIGHQRIIHELVQTAKSRHSQSILITFYPHPKKIIDQGSAHIKMLLSKKEKEQILDSLGLDILVIVPFTVEFSQLLAADFVEGFLMKQFDPAVIVVGFDHKFGIHGSGDMKLLRAYEAEQMFTVIEIPKLVSSQTKISSSFIRSLVQINDFEKIREFLGRPYSIQGTVVSGQRIGTTLGYPTANLEPDDPDKLLPNDGIYAAVCYIQDRSFESMLYIGTRPTLGEKLKTTIEIHLFDFKEDIYHSKIKIDVIKFIRPDEKFTTIDELKRKITEDERNVKIVLRPFSLLYQKSAQPQVAIAVLNYNGQKYLEEFLPAMIKFKPDNATLYIIDNASTDDSIYFLERNYPEITIIRLLRNYGFAGGYNKGLSQIKSDYFAIVNSDVKINSDWISPLLDKMIKNPEVFITQPKIKSLTRPNEFEYAGAAGGLIDFIGYPFCFGRILDNLEEDKGQYESEREIFWASGAAMLVKASVFEKLRGFDSEYFAHQEEIDFCWRVKRMGGKVMYIPSGEVFHLGGGTLAYDHPQKVYLNFKNNLYTIFKNIEWYKLYYILPIRLILDVLIGISFIFKGKFSIAISILKAYVVAISSTLFLVQKKKNTDALIKTYSFKKSNLRGMLKGSIFVQYYLFNKRTVGDISSHNFIDPNA